MGHVALRRFEKQNTPFPLGRHIQHDSRSRSFTFPVPATPVRHTTVLWPHSTPVLNQGDKSSCTGNAMVQLLNCDMFAQTRRLIKSLPEADAATTPWLTEADALKVYSLGTHYDGFGPSQYYPPNDDGGSGLGVAKAAQELGFIDSYLHCYTFAQFQAAIQTQPVIVGTSWTNPMFNPDPSTGLVTVGQLNDNTVVGGHEWAVLGIDYQRLCVVGLNSWGPGWGGGPGLSNGQFRVSFNDFQALLADDGDIVVPHAVGLS